MAMYRCSRCDEFKDNDYDACTEDPSVEFGLMCGECAAEVEETPEIVQRGVFTKQQIEVIKRMKMKIEAYFWAVVVWFTRPNIHEQFLAHYRTQIRLIVRHRMESEDGL